MSAEARVHLKELMKNMSQECLNEVHGLITMIGVEATVSFLEEVMNDVSHNLV